MRLRVLGVLSVLCLVVVFLVSGTILSSAARELTQEVQINRVASLNRLAQVAFDAAGDGDTARLQREMDTYSALYAEGIVVRLQQETLQLGGLSEARADVQDALSLARLNVNGTALAPLEPLGSGPQVIFRPFGSANQVLGGVAMEVNLDAARAKLQQRWLVVGAAAVALAAVLLLAAARVTGWVLRPVLRLNSAVTELGRTGRAGRLPEDGPPELRELSRSFTAMARTVSDSIESQRQLIADTSHQLRNPIGALRLRLDVLQLELKTEREHDAAASAVAELERVEEILDDVLKLAAAEHRASGRRRQGLQQPGGQARCCADRPLPRPAGGSGAGCPRCGPRRYAAGPRSPAAGPRPGGVRARPSSPRWWANSWATRSSTPREPPSLLPSGLSFPRSQWKFTTTARGFPNRTSPRRPRGFGGRPSTPRSGEQAWA